MAPGMSLQMEESAPAADKGCIEVSGNCEAWYKDSIECDKVCIECDKD